MTESRIAHRLRAYGVGERFSIRDAAKRTGLSRETISRLMRPVEHQETRRIRSENLDKIADGLGIPRDLLEREMMADWGYVQAVTDSDVAGVLSQITDFSPTDLARLISEIARIQESRLVEAEVDREADPERA